MGTDDHETAKKMAGEMVELQKRGSLHFVLGPLECFSLLACLQLAWRHPNLSATQKELIERFGRRLQAAFEDLPTVRQVAEKGWDREFDRGLTPPGPGRE